VLPAAIDADISRLFFVGRLFLNSCDNFIYVFWIAALRSQ